MFSLIFSHIHRVTSTNDFQGRGFALFLVILITELSTGDLSIFKGIVNTFYLKIASKIIFLSLSKMTVKDPGHFRGLRLYFSNSMKQVRCRVPFFF